MSTVWPFLVKFASLIVCILHCFDRVIFKGHLALSAPCELEYFVDRILKVRRSDFMKTIAPQYSDRLVAYAQGWRRRPAESTCIAPASSARTNGPTTSSAATVSPKGSSVSSVPRKRVPPLACARSQTPSVRQPTSAATGALLLLPRSTVRPDPRPRTDLAAVHRPGLRNGHEWLAQQMVHKKVGFVQLHNAFTELDDPVEAQRLADRFAQLNWPKILDRWARQVNPLLGRRQFSGDPVHWVVDQAEYATDLLFASRRRWPACTTRSWIMRC